MNKAELIDAVQTKVGGTRTDAAKYVDAALSVVTTCVRGSEDVAIAGFGTFAVKNTAARKGRNPKTKEAIDIPAGKKVSFKPGKGLKEALQ